MFLQDPIRSIRYTHYKLFDTIGSRKEYELEYFERRERLCTFAVLSMSDGRKEYIDALQDILWSICDEYTWCLPPHLNGQSLIPPSTSTSQEENGKLIKGCRPHEQQIDLFAAETAFALAEVLDILENKLDLMVVYRCRDEIKKRVFEPYLQMNSMFEWETYTNNWAAVCAGSIGCAALYLMTDSSMLATVIKKVMGTLECFISGYEEDGGCTEGLGYWYYGFGFYTYFAELLSQRTNGRIQLLNNEKIKQIAMFQQKCYLSNNKIISFSDAFLEWNHHSGLLHYLKGIFSDIQIPDSSLASDFHFDHCYRWANIIRNLAWTGPDVSCVQENSSSDYLANCEWFISRKKLEDCVFAFAAKGGNNNEHHNHNDIGSFIFHVNGDTIIVDPGKGEYTKDYFGPKRYSYLCNGSQGHCVPIIEDEYQAAGTEHYAKIMEVDSSPHKDTLIMEMARAYDNKKLDSLLRKFVFDIKEKGCLSIVDEYSFNEIPSRVKERLISFYMPMLVGEDRINIRTKRASVDILFDPNCFNVQILEEVFMTHSGKKSKVFILDLEFKKMALQMYGEIVIKGRRNED
ncbi:MAG: heparinase II/III family protein [Vallitaleaceae bacterium]|nr:heparinase II/III family protein [Vallitaleaceae bacterium]